MKYFLSTIIILMFFSLFAEKPIHISKNVQGFFYKINIGEDNYHRSGLNSEDSSLIPSEAKKKWKNNINKPFKIVENKNISMFEEKMFSKVLVKKEYNINYSKNNTVVFEKKNDPVPEDIIETGLSEVDYSEIAAYYINEVDGISESVEIEGIGIERAQCLDCKNSFYNEERVSGIYVRFRRIFNGGIVRGNISKISIKLDPDGSLRNMRIEWPEFEEAADSLDIMSFEENLSTLVTGLSSDKGAHVVLSSTATLEIDGYEIDGAAKAWLPVEKDSEILIIPGMSYKLNVFVTGDEPVLTKIVDYPLVPDFIKFNKK